MGTRRTSDVLILLLFGAGSFVAAGLLFLMQPMVAKMVLPVLGGAPAVWNTAMVFFQAMLLLGYGYAHVTTRYLGPRRQALAHVLVLLLPLAVLPFSGPIEAPLPIFGSLELAVLAVFAVMVGLPFFVVATASPLFQRWLAATDHPAGRDPYFLYAAGNVASLSALLAYPFVVERVLPAPSQAGLWTGGYLLYVILALACIVVLRRRSRPLRRTAQEIREPVPAERTNRPPWSLRARWLAYAFLPSSLLLGVTTYLSTDIAAVPLLWVVPLAIYLLTYIVAFAGRSPLGLLGRAVPALVVAVLSAIWMKVDAPVVPVVMLHLVTLFGVGLLFHGKLVAARPHPSRLTEFYLFMSLGGVLGGVFNALVAPLVFTSLFEYPLVLVLALAGVSAAASSTRRLLGQFSPRILPPVIGFLAAFLGAFSLIVTLELGLNSRALIVLAGGLVAGSCYSLAQRVPRAALAGFLGVLVFIVTAPGTAVFADRTFFGVHRVVEDGEQRKLTHGTTVHGVESLLPERLGEPLSYYSRRGPFGDIATATVAGHDRARVAVVGLGTGALAAYGEPGQRYDFYEIDPVVVQIAQDTALFSYLDRARADTRIVIGDGRLTLAEAGDGVYDLIVLDAFSSDSIPVHLLTREALELYRGKLAPEGVLAFHISNRYLALEPVLAAVGAELGLAGMVAFDEISQDDPGRTQDSPSHWLVLAPDAQALAGLEGNDHWRPLARDERVRAWTDDYSDIVRVLRRW